MAALLTLPHFLNIAMVKALRAKRFSAKRLSALSGTTFDLQSLIAEVMHQESWDNATSILMDGRDASDLLDEYVQQCNAILSSVKGSNRRPIVDLLNSNRVYLTRDNRFKKAYSNFNAAVASIR
jgi:prephenate dehydrogenase